jgi:hypothetical protein
LDDIKEFVMNDFENAVKLHLKSIVERDIVAFGEFLYPEHGTWY